MTHTNFARLFHALLAPALAAFLGACAPSSTSYGPPPTFVSSTSIVQARTAPTATLIVGEFENPNRPQLSWRDVGPGISEALSRALLNRGRYDVVIKPTLSRRLQQLVGNRAPQNDPTLAEVREEHPDVDYVVIGAVTDFHHTSDLPLEIRPKNWLGNPRSDAIVAIDLVVVDLRNERLVSAEHITGTAPAGKTKTRELYRDVAFGSYIFWNTPLGRASTEAITRSVSRIDALIPSGPAMPTYAGKGFGSARVAQMTSLRGVAITGGRNCGLVGEQLYALLPAGAAVEKANLLRDQSTGRLLLVKIDASRDAEATGWLLGKCDDPRLVVGAELRPVPAAVGDDVSTAQRSHAQPTDMVDEDEADSNPPAGAAVTQASPGISPE